MLAREQYVRANRTEVYLLLLQGVYLSEVAIEPLPGKNEGWTYADMAFHLEALREAQTSEATAAFQAKVLAYASARVRSLWNAFSVRTTRMQLAMHNQPTGPKLNEAETDHVIATGELPDRLKDLVDANRHQYAIWLDAKNDLVAQIRTELDVPNVGRSLLGLRRH